MPSSGEINFTVVDVCLSLDKIENTFEGDFDKLDGISYFSEDFGSMLEDQILNQCSD